MKIELVQALVFLLFEIDQNYVQIWHYQNSSKYITYLKLVETFDNYDSTVQIGFFLKRKHLTAKTTFL